MHFHSAASKIFVLNLAPQISHVQGFFIDIARINEILRFTSRKPIIHPANKCWHFNIYEQDKFRAQQS